MYKVSVFLLIANLSFICKPALCLNSLEWEMKNQVRSYKLLLILEFELSWVLNKQVSEQGLESRSRHFEYKSRNQNASSWTGLFQNRNQYWISESDLISDLQSSFGMKD